MRHLIELLDASVSLFSDRAAAIHSGGSVTFGELGDLVEAFSRHLRERFGVGPGDRVALVMPNCLHSAVCYLGVIRSKPRYLYRQQPCHASLIEYSLR